MNAIRQEIVGDCRVNLNARHQPAGERRLEDVEQAGSGHADEDDLVREDRMDRCRASAPRASCSSEYSKSKKE